MAGRIVDEDMKRLREQIHIEDVIGEHLTLRRAGADLIGLCPFHDEKTASFHVTPARGLFYCFGCGVGGDVFKFVQEVDNLSFNEAAQQLADRIGLELHFTDSGSGSPKTGQRQRLLAANQAAAEFFAAQLLTPEGIKARQLLDDRGFDREVATAFGVGYAPKDGQALHRHLGSKGFSDEELVQANLIRANGGWDVFQGRVIWPIRDSATTTLGFGARRLYDDDRQPAKYINTAETTVYKKSQVLYGLDLARGPIGKQGQAIVMEGYTDVMAAHLSGLETAVASCGTAFGDDHARLLQRLIGQPKAGRIVFTFDGDEAGQKAALKVFNLDDHFTVPTYVAVAPDGLDPCDLRLQRGDSAVRDLVVNPKPLYQFIMEDRVARFDLERADSRIEAVRAVAPLLSAIRDHDKWQGFVESLAGIVGIDIDKARKIVLASHKASPAGAKLSPKPPSPTAPEADGSTAATLPGEKAQNESPPIPYPAANDPRLAAERGLMQLMLQYPTYFTTDWCGLDPADFRHPAYRAIFEAVLVSPLGDGVWIELVQAKTDDPVVKRLEIELSVAPLMTEPNEAYADAYAARVRLGRLNAQLETLRSRLQRMNPVTQAEDHQPLFAEVVELEALKAHLTRQALGV